MIVAGVDEVGRGPLAGPVITAAVILPDSYNLPGLADSKKLSLRLRQKLDLEIRDQALSWAYGSASIEEIDRLNILHATMLAMQRAVSALDMQPQKILVDGNRCPEFGVPAEAIVGGDGLQDCISAASIIAKVERDELMRRYAEEYPDYGWQKNSGYPTPQHLAAIEKFGVTPYHRRSFGPVARQLDLELEL